MKYSGFFLPKTCVTKSINLVFLKVQYLSIFLFWAAEKRSRHLGSDGIYLDDITELEPDVAALYFPKR